MAYDLRPLERWIVEQFEPAVRVNGVAGRYGRHPGAAEPELYGLADMACILHTLGVLQPDAETPAVWQQELAALADGDTGYIVERDPSHSRLHNTAFALGAMHLLGIRGRPLRFARDYDTPEKLARFLDSLDWAGRVYRCSHDGAGLASAFALVDGTVGPEWFDAYFDLLDDLFDPRNGMIGRGKPAGGDVDQIGGTFHYAFLYEHFHRRMPFAEPRIDRVLDLQQPDGLWHDQNLWWLTLDGVYLLTRTVRHSHHRPDAVAAALRRALDNRVAALAGPEDWWAMFSAPLGVHLLTATVSLFAEAQAFLGAAEVVTTRPLRLVLDSRPFI